MMRLATWALYVAILACITYFAGLYAIPFGVMARVEARLSPNGLKTNQIHHADRPNATSRTVVRPSPDLLYSLCYFDVSSGPVRVVSGAPQDTYWSVALYASNTDNFFVLNDQEAGGQSADIIIYGPHAPMPSAPSTAKLVESPSRKGVVLIRTLINDEAKLPEIDGARRQATCSPWTG
ncbi:MAG TPA: hypothetical protein DCL54_01625 [Alphaproteobacteria bacterium]|nr:hypothetical protein [Alphaproteobacteria bacterium]